MMDLIASEPRLVIIGAAGIIVFLVWSVCGVIKAREAERSRRELYAYVAEGSISSKEAERLIRAAKEDEDLAVLMGMRSGKEEPSA